MNTPNEPELAAAAQPGAGSRRAFLLGGGAVVGGAALLGATPNAGALAPTTRWRAQTSGESALDRIVRDKKMKVGVDLGFRPLQYKDPDNNNEPTGYSIEITKLLAKALDAQIEYVEVPFADTFSALAAGRFDLSGIQATPTPARAQKVGFALVPSFIEGSYMLAKKDAGLTKNADLNQESVTLAVLGGSAQAAVAALQFPKAKLKELPDQAATVADVASGRATALFIGDFGIKDAIAAGLALVENTPVVSSWNTYYVPIDDIKLQLFLTEFLQFKAADLTLASLWDKFVGGENKAAGITSAAVYDPYLAAAKVMQAPQA